MLWSLKRQSADLSVFSDASGVWGCGAYITSKWFSLKWCSRLQPLPVWHTQLNVRILRRLKEELAWVIDEWLRSISNKMLFKTVVPLRNIRIKPF